MQILKLKKMIKKAKKKNENEGEECDNLNGVYSCFIFTFINNSYWNYSIDLVFL